MPERIEKLRALLDELENELHGVEALDDQSRALLQETAGEIQTLLQKEGADTDEHNSLSDKLGDTVAEFESSHPTLHAVVHRIIYVLGQMGI